MKQVIIVTGHLAALKSTVASNLSKDLGIIVLKKDEIKEVLGRQFEWREPNQKRYMDYAAVRVVMELMEKILAVNESIILEADFCSADIDLLRIKCKRLNFNPIIIFMTGEVEALYERFLMRDKYRPEIHKLLDIKDIVEFEDTMIPYNPKVYGDDVILVDTTSFSDDDYRILMQEVNERLA